ncbi:FAD-dependent oxidoreductase [Patescibacteria group bacterium]|nr:FAD-dependent oxidoreductase [Patescibacteria group bacterium]
MRDLIIIGGGPGGLCAGVYSARRKLDTLLITEELGGYVSKTDKIENYLGFKSISGPELAKKFIEHLRSYKVEVMEDMLVKRVYQKGSKVIVNLENGDSVEAKIAIVAAGGGRKKLNIPGEDKFTKKGITYCTICDGPLFKGQDVAIIGGGSSGIRSALYLSKIAKKIYLLEVEDKLKGEDVLVDELKKLQNVTIITKAKTLEIFGGKSVEGLRYIDLGTKKENELKVKGISVELGIGPHSEIVNVKKDKRGHIKVDGKMRTSRNRIFAIGDINDKGPEQIAVAIGQGCIAALEADKIINSKKTRKR